MPIDLHAGLAQFNVLSFFFFFFFYLRLPALLLSYFEIRLLFRHSQMLFIDYTFIDFSEYLVLKWKIPSHFKGGFSGNPHLDSGLTQSSVRDGFEVTHAFALRTDFQLLKKRLRASFFWDGPLRIQGNYVLFDWPPRSQELIFSPAIICLSPVQYANLLV